MTGARFLLLATIGLCAGPIVWIFVRYRSQPHVDVRPRRVHPSIPADLAGRPRKEPTLAPDPLIAEPYRIEWRAIKARFGTFPGLAIAQADELLARFLEGGEYRRPDAASRVATAKLGAVLRTADRQDLRRFFAHYASILDEALAGPSEIALESPPAQRREIDLRRLELITGRRGGVR